MRVSGHKRGTESVLMLNVPLTKVGANERVPARPVGS